MRVKRKEIIVKEIQQLNRRMENESLVSAASIARYYKMYGAQRALRWSLGVVRYSPIEIIHDRKKMGKAAQTQGW